MNIFVLDTDPVLCAAYHCDKHAVKMCIEYAQLLSTGARQLGLNHDGYKSTHENHPCTRWVSDGVDNWLWTYDLAVALGAEYSRRYGRVHKSTEALRLLPYDLRSIVKRHRPSWFIAVVPEQFMHNDDAVETYRDYYATDKASFARWKDGAVPGWFKERTQVYKEF